METNLVHLPVWSGLIKKPYVSRNDVPAAPICLQSQASGFWTIPKEFRYSTKYESIDYQFITSPPGASHYASSLSDNLYRFILTTLKSDFSPNSYLEIGSGSTYFSERMIREFNSLKEVTLIDPALTPSSEVLENLRNDRLRVLIAPHYFDSTLPESYFTKNDLVVCSNTLEHVSDIEEFLNLLRKCTHNSSLIFFEIPVIDREIRERDLNMFLHEHINYFTFEGVIRVIENFGLRVLKTEFVENGSALLACRLGNRAGQSLGAPRDATEAYMDLEPWVRAAKTLYNRLLCSNPALVVGATNGLNNVLYLNSNQLTEGITVFDSDTSKVGLYLPMVRTCVRGIQEVQQHEGGVIHIAALNFAPQISGHLREILGDNSRVSLLV